MAPSSTCAAERLASGPEAASSTVIASMAESVKISNCQSPSPSPSRPVSPAAPFWRSRAVTVRAAPAARAMETRPGASALSSSTPKMATAAVASVGLISRTELPSGRPPPGSGASSVTRW